VGSERVKVFDMRFRLAVVAVGALATGATLAVALVPGLRFAYHLPALHVASETAGAIIALAAAALLVARARSSYRLDDLLLAAAFVLLSCSKFFFAALPVSFGSGSDRFSLWAPDAGRLVGAAVLAWAAFAPRHRLVRPRRAAALAVAGCGGALLVAAGVGIAANRFPLGFSGPVSGAATAHVHFVGNPSVVALPLAGALLFLIAAIGFARRCGSGRAGGLAGWIAVAAVLALYSRVNYVLYPALDAGWIYVAEAYRLLFYGLVAGAAARDLVERWQAAAAAAVLEERRRLARDLHDGLTQELLLLTSRTSQLAWLRDAPRELIVPVASASQRALEESRRAVEELTRPPDEPLELALSRTADGEP
jgi:signal transduction histidine kinase